MRQLPLPNFSRRRAAVRAFTGSSGLGVDESAGWVDVVTAAAVVAAVSACLPML